MSESLINQYGGTELSLCSEYIKKYIYMQGVFFFYVTTKQKNL